MQIAQIQNGSYCNQPISGMFPVIKGLMPSTKFGFFITVDASDSVFKNPKIRVRVEKESDVVMIESASGMYASDEDSAPVFVPDPETDEEAIERIAERFKILDEMTEATIDGVVRGLIVSGPPGVGKTFGVEQVLEKDSLFDVIADRPLRHTFVKGSMSPIGLYSTLYKYSDEKNIIILDDCDSILFDEDALNILKAALDSGKKRNISWHSDSHFLRREGVPEEFEFKGSVIFITNLKFDKVKSSKIKDHLEAIMSRCHYLDLTISTVRDKILRIKQIARDGGLFSAQQLSKPQEAEIIDFMVENQTRLREISLRMAQKIADLCKMQPNNDRWKRLAESTCMKQA